MESAWLALKPMRKETHGSRDNFAVFSVLFSKTRSRFDNGKLSNTTVLNNLISGLIIDNEKILLNFLAVRRTDLLKVAAVRIYAQVTILWQNRIV